MTLGTKGFGLDIGKLFEPRSVAVIGASERKGSPGEAVLRNLLRARFKGRVYPINPKYEKLGRRRCYPDVRSVGKEIDLLRKVTSNTLKLRSNMRNYPDLIDKNIRYSYAVFKSKRQSLRHSVMRGLNGRIRKTG